MVLPSSFHQTPAHVNGEVVFCFLKPLGRRSVGSESYMTLRGRSSPEGIKSSTENALPVPSCAHVVE